MARPRGRSEVVLGRSRHRRPCHPCRRRNVPGCASAPALRASRSRRGIARCAEAPARCRKTATPRRNIRRDGTASSTTAPPANPSAVYASGYSLATFTHSAASCRTADSSPGRSTRRNHWTAAAAENLPMTGVNVVTVQGLTRDVSATRRRSHRLRDVSTEAPAGAPQGVGFTNTRGATLHAQGLGTPRGGGGEPRLVPRPPAGVGLAHRRRAAAANNTGG
jgi:hypothetical protein